MMEPYLVPTYGLAVVAFVVGTVLAVRLATDEDRAKEGAFGYLVVIPAFAGVSYLLMLLDVGTLTIGTETIVLPRYVDWLVTTPILVGYVGYAAGAPRKWILAVVVADVAMILTGLVATVLPTPEKWLFFVVSSLFHLSLFAVLYGIFPRYARRHPGRRGLFKLLQNHVGLLWLAYPLVWFVGAPGLGLVSLAALGLIFAYLDVVAKVPYVYFVWNRRDSFGADTDARSAAPVAESSTARPADD